MSQTQLGSMFIGTSSSSESVRRDMPTPGAIIHIVDKHTNRILDDIKAEEILENEHYRSLLDSLETLEFTTFADKRYSPHLERRNRVVIPDDDRGYMEFIISESVKLHEEGDMVETEVYADASYLELKKSKVIEPQTLTEYNVTMHANFALNDTAWRVGVVESNQFRTITIENHTNPYNYLRTVANEFDLELNFRVEVQGNQIVGRYVDLVEQIGEWRGTEVEFGRNLGSIKRTGNTDELVTALIGLGPEPVEEGEERLEVFVEDREAFQLWGFIDRDGEKRHLIEDYTPQSDRMDMTLEELRQYTQTELNKRVTEAIQYESEILDLEHVPGLHNYKLRFGDTLRIKDTLFNPPLYLEARIHSQRRNIKDRGRKQVTLGDYVEYTEEEVTAIWQQLQQEIRQKIGTHELLEYAEPKRVESITAPENTDRIWVDTSQPERAIKAFDGETWRSIGDVTGENTANDVDNVGGTPSSTVRDNASDGRSAKETIDENRFTWDRASIFNEDGTLDVERLYGLIPDEALVSADQWNGQGTFIDENGVYTGTVIAEQLVGGSFMGETFEGGTFIGSNFIQSGDDGSVVIDDDGIALQGQYSSIQLRTSGMDGEDPIGEGYAALTFNSTGDWGSLEIYQDDATSMISAGSSLHLSAEGTMSLAAESGVYVPNYIEISGSGASNGLRLGNGPLSHIIVPHNTNGYMVVYPQRQQGHDVFRIRSHHMQGSYRNEFGIAEDGRFYSPHLYNNTSSNSSQARVSYWGGDSSNGTVYRVTSARKYKQDIKQAHDVDHYLIHSLNPMSWLDKGDIARNGGSTEGVDRSYGLIADEVADIGLGQYVEYDQGEVEGLAYERLWTLLIPISRDHEEKIKRLEDEVSELKERLNEGER